jgi:hypothetical protein
LRLRRHVRTAVESGGFVTAEMGCDSEVVGGEGTVGELVEQSLAGFDPQSRAAFVAPDHDVVDPPWWYSRPVRLVYDQGILLETESVASLAGVRELPGVLVVDAQVAERLAAGPEPYAAALGGRRSRPRG